MANQLQITVNITVLGDGVSTSITLALDEWPFPPNLPGRVTTMQTGNTNVQSVTFTSKIVIITFVTPFTGGSSVGMFITYDPS